MINSSRRALRSNDAIFLSNNFTHQVLNALIVVAITTMCACSPSSKCSSSKKQQFMNGITDVALKIDIADKDLQEWADSMLPDTLFQDDDMGEQGVEILVKKDGRPVLDLENKLAKASVPLKIFAKKSLGFMNASAEGSLILHVNSLIDIAEDWSWSTDTKIDSIEWVEEPKLKIMGLKLSVKSMIDNYIRESEKELTSQIDDAVKDNQLLQNILKTVHPSFERSYAADPDGYLFIQVFPKVAGMAPFTKKDGKVLSAVGLQGMAVIRPDSAATTSKVDTPKYNWIKRTNDNQNVKTNIQLNEAELQEMVKTNVKGEEFEFRGKKSTIDQFFLSLQNQKIKADVYLSGGIKGMIHFEGKPTWKEKSNELEFCDADVDLKIERGLPKFLLWTFQSTIKKRMVSAIEDAVNNEIKARVKEVNKYLNDFEAGKNVRINASIKDYDVAPIQIDNKKLQLGIVIDVEGEMNVQGLKLKIH